MLRALNYFYEVLSELPVEFRFGTTLTGDVANTFDEVIVATGAVNAMPPIKGSELPQVVSSWDVLDKKALVFGKVAVIGGGLVGVETAEYLANQGCEVTIIEMLDAIAKEESVTVMPTLTKELDAHKVVRLVNTKLDEIGTDSITVTTTENENTTTQTISADFVVMAVGARKNLPDMEGVTVPVHYVGDCAGDRPSNINHAVESAYEVANSL